MRLGPDFNRSRPLSSPRLIQRVAGLSFVNPLGLAAGFDKRSLVPDVLMRLGFGAVEVGGITKDPQAGNPRPRIARDPKNQALCNWMGLPNDGAAATAKQLRRYRLPLGYSRLPGVLGANIAGRLVDDFLETVAILAGSVDYVTLNISCPNDPTGVKRPDEIARLCQGAKFFERPIFLKLSPDLTLQESDELCDIALEQGIAGFVWANTSAKMARDRGFDRGGYSGAPRFDETLAGVRRIYRRTDGRLAIIGLGGIFTAQQAYEVIAAGASLIQIYTAFVYKGPGVVQEIVGDLDAHLQKEELTICQAVGRNA